jgi:hypothetical protein
MPIPLSHMKERLSVAYVRTVVAKAGAQFIPEDGTEYGTDAIIRKVLLLANGKYASTGWALDCQIKATTNWIEEDDHLVYDMEVDAYNKLVTRQGSTSCILILFRLPINEADWLRLDEESLLLKNCCYWMCLEGQRSSNKSTVRIRIPRKHLFTPDSVNNLLDRITANHGKLS